MQQSDLEAGIGLRKLVVYREVVVTEADARPVHPAQQASVAAVVHNPWVGTGPTHDLSGETARGSWSGWTALRRATRHLNSPSRKPRCVARR